jgi:hypothetical protein
MPSWGGVLREIKEATASQPGAPALDVVRRKYLASQHAHSKRAVILYATKWTQHATGVPPTMISVADGDIVGFMEAIHGIEEKELDLILHSPGGSLAAADSIVQYLRSKFTHIRVFVPHAAMSAATMLSCAANEIVMGKHSFLGPIDPQLILGTPLGQRAIPAKALLDQFNRAKDECRKDPLNLPVWVPMLQQYGPDMLVQCENVSVLSQKLVEQWLRTWMLNGVQDGPAKAAAIAAWLADHGEHKLHGKYINREELRAKGVNVVNLEDDKKQQDFILSIFHATAHTFNQSHAVKIVENHRGAAFIEQAQMVVTQAGPKNPGPSPEAPKGPILGDELPGRVDPPFKKKENPFGPRK